MKILITGGAGFIGSHLVDALSRFKRNKIIIFDNFYRGTKENIVTHLKNKNIKIINEDIRNFKSFKKIGNVDLIFHLAAQSNVIGSYLNPDYAFSANIIGTYNVLKFASKIRPDRFIFSSSREVYGNPEYIPVDENHPLKPINMYGATKVSGEMLCNSFINSNNIKITILRIANVYGSRDKDRVIPIFLNNIKNKKNLILYGGKQVLDFLWIKDLINCVINISKNSKFVGETINIGTGTGVSIEDLAKKIIKITDSKSKIIRKKSRSLDVKSFIAKSNLIKLKTLKLDRGLQLLIKSELNL